MKRQTDREIETKTNQRDLAPPPPSVRSEAEGQPFRLRSKKLRAQLETCLANPERVLFLDIETTGLSHYYDDITIIGWTIGGRGETVVRGLDKGGFFEAVSNAIGMVTFNGIRFDTKFIARDHPDLVLPKLHIDLMYLCRRVGLTGGQKAIEKELNINVRKGLQDLEGFHAVLLWHQYIRGDLDSLFRLICYNRADIAAMGAIFDECIDRLAIQATLFEKPGNFFQWSSPKSWNTAPRTKLTPSNLISERHTLDSLFDDEELAGIKVVGIDLTGSEKRKSGWCLMKGKVCKVESLRHSQELIDWTVRESPDLVSIDSPLCLPAGRTSVWDDDPGRERFGIMRQCERELKRRGINVYPSLIPSMQKLTKRGIYLASELRDRGIAVIESYPGAAQDIMKIPRKGAGKDFLKQGLREFGILEDDTLELANHDELDAITAAVVAVFHWLGMSEPLGTEEEEPLIIPCTSKRSVSTVIGVSGRIAAGKTTIARALEKVGFRYTRFSLTIDDMLVEKGVRPTRAARQALGREINASGRQRDLCDKTLERVGKADAIVVDGLRFLQDRAWMAENFGSKFTHVHVDAEISVRRRRFVQLEGNEDFVNAEGALVEREVDRLAGSAHQVFSNESEISALENFALSLAKSIRRET